MREFSGKAEFECRARLEGRKSNSTGLPSVCERLAGAGGTGWGDRAEECRGIVPTLARTRGWEHPQPAGYQRAQTR
jgi:hypothetical protein